MSRLGAGNTQSERPKVSGGFEAANQMPRRLPIGAEVVPGGGVSFRVWAPMHDEVSVELARGRKWSDAQGEVSRLEAEPGGYFSAVVPQAEAAMLYRFRLANGSFPDPASRFQPEGPHGPSQVIDPLRFQWCDLRWSGVSRKGQVIYELHVGTFTPEGTWMAAQERLPELAELGITVIELMPVADFPGRFGWGYDGVNLFAPTRLYGTPEDFRAFVDAAHQLGLGVILDVVYNHFGPDGNYLREFSKDYFTERYKNEWGDPLNFDGPNSTPVREFFTANARYWIEEFHLDGLRLDATQQIFDSSSEHIIGAITRAVRAAAGTRQVYLVGENEPQEVNLIRPLTEGGYGLDALWNDDFHHSATVALTGHNEAYYLDYRGSPQEFVSAAKWGYLYQGQWYRWQKQPRGKPALEVSPEQFVTYLQNHDQVANSVDGKRDCQLACPGTLRALTALLLLGPGTPMLFQGQEFGASSPFFYFADHNAELAKLVEAGRSEFLAQFPSIAAAEAKAVLRSPGDVHAFQKSKLRWTEREEHSEVLSLHRDLLRLRREDPALGCKGPRRAEGAVLGPEAFVLRFFGEDRMDRLLIVNLGLDLPLSPAPEPLLAPPEDCGWEIAWSSESPKYGGRGTPELDTKAGWKAPGRAAVLLRPSRLLLGVNGENEVKTRRSEACPK